MNANVKRPNTLEFGISKPNETITTLLRESANHEIDWLWAAEQTKDTAERYFCIAYALYINPDNADARRALKAHLAESRDLKTQPASAWGVTLRQLVTSLISG